MGLVVAQKRRGPASVGRRLMEALRLVRTSERWVMDTSGRKKGSTLVGRLVEASGLLKNSSVVRAARLHLRRGRPSQFNGKISSVAKLVEASRLLRISSVVKLVEASRLLKISSVVRAAKLHMRRGRSSQLNGWELLLLLIVHVVPAT